MTRADIITGSFGAGKTTAIRWLMANKPPDELWIVILNEFTDAGIDALQVAEAARGSYDVRLVAGGCLCCVGELEFAKQLRDILRNFRPARLLIEPSGAGHAADIIDTLSIYEAQRALTLSTVVCLVDALDAERILRTRAATEWSQIQSADALLLSKPDLAGDLEHQAFEAIAAAQYPSKRYVGTCSRGELPPGALQDFSRAPSFSLLAAPASPALGLAASAVPRQFSVGGHMGRETESQQLGLWAVQWRFPRELVFSRVIIEPRVRWMLEAHRGWFKRMKAVIRTGPGPSWLIQSTGQGIQAEDSAFRRDSRCEIVLSAAPSEAFLEQWRGIWRDAANP